MYFNTVCLDFVVVVFLSTLHSPSKARLHLVANLYPLQITVPVVATPRVFPLCTLSSGVNLNQSKNNLLNTPCADQGYCNRRYLHMTMLLLYSIFMQTLTTSFKTIACKISNTTTMKHCWWKLTLQCFLFSANHILTWETRELTWLIIAWLSDWWLWFAVSADSCMSLRKQLRWTKPLTDLIM